MNQTVFVPLCRLGAGTGRGAIEGAWGDEIPVEVTRFRLVGVVACLELPVLRADGDLREVVLPGGLPVWVRPLRERAAA